MSSIAKSDAVIDSALGDFVRFFRLKNVVRNVYWSLFFLGGACSDGIDISLRDIELTYHTLFGAKCERTRLSSSLNLLKNTKFLVIFSDTRVGRERRLQLKIYFSFFAAVTSDSKRAVKQFKCNLNLNVNVNVRTSTLKSKLEYSKIEYSKIELKKEKEKTYTRARARDTEPATDCGISDVTIQNSNSFVSATECDESNGDGKRATKRGRLSDERVTDCGEFEKRATDCGESDDESATDCDTFCGESDEPATICGTSDCQNNPEPKERFNKYGMPVAREGESEEEFISRRIKEWARELDGLPAKPPASPQSAPKEKLHAELSPGGLRKLRPPDDNANNKCVRSLNTSTEDQESPARQGILKSGGASAPSSVAPYSALAPLSTTTEIQENARPASSTGDNEDAPDDDPFTAPIEPEPPLIPTSLGLELLDQPLSQDLAANPPTINGKFIPITDMPREEKNGPRPEMKKIFRDLRRARRISPDSPPSKTRILAPEYGDVGWRYRVDRSKEVELKEILGRASRALDEHREMPAYHDGLPPLKITPEDAKNPKALAGKLLELWRRYSGRRRVQLTRKRELLVKDRLDEGYEPDQLARAVCGICLSPWHYENRKDSIELAIRSGEDVEKAVDYWVQYEHVLLVWSYGKRSGEDVSSRYEDFRKWKQRDQHIEKQIEIHQRALNKEIEELDKKQADLNFWNSIYKNDEKREMVKRGLVQNGTGDQCNG